MDDSPLRVPIHGRGGVIRAYTLVDPGETWVLEKRWWLQGPRDGPHYAVCRHDGKMAPLHRLLMQPPSGLVVDHINGDPLDNRRANLRVCTQGENAMNRRRKSKGKWSQHRGVTYHIRSRKWVAQIRIDGKQRTFYCDSEDEAATLAATLRRRQRSTPEDLDSRLPRNEAKRQWRASRPKPKVPFQCDDCGGKTGDRKSLLCRECWKKKRRAA